MVARTFTLMAIDRDGFPLTMSMLSDDPNWPLHWLRSHMADTFSTPLVRVCIFDPFSETIRGYHITPDGQILPDDCTVDEPEQGRIFRTLEEAVTVARRAWWRSNRTASTEVKRVGHVGYRVSVGPVAAGA